MPHSLSRNWVHLVFSTKERQPLISPAIENRLYNVFRARSRNLKCYLSRVNGMPDHVHLLVRLHPSVSLAKYVQHLKGASAHQINAEEWIAEKFAWQKGYAAFSVSEPRLEKVQKYIERQKDHHRITSFTAEWNKPENIQT